VAAGDFNESVDEWRQAGLAYQVALVPVDENPPAAFLDRTILLADERGEAGIRGSALALYDPWFEIPEADRGSYSYQHRWQTVDHVLLSPGLFDDTGWRYRPGGFRVVRLPFMLNPDGTPKRWTRLAGQRGYSDHLPLLLSLDAAN
jgi:endonuclease/exonuclease/phosphatase family metal-dependent hydrolase